MNRINLDGKVLHIDFDSEQIFVQDPDDETYPYVTVLASDPQGNEYQLIYPTTDGYKKLAKKMLGEKRLTPKLVRLTLDLYEQLTHLSYCDWRMPESYGMI